MSMPPHPQQQPKASPRGGPNSTTQSQTTTSDWLHRIGLPHYCSNFRSFPTVRSLALTIYPNGYTTESTHAAEKTLQKQYAILALGARRKIASALQPWTQLNPSSTDDQQTAMSTLEPTGLLTAPVSGQRFFRASSAAVPPKHTRIKPSRALQVSPAKTEATELRKPTQTSLTTLLLPSNPTNRKRVPSAPVDSKMANVAVEAETHLTKIDCKPVAEATSTKQVVSSDATSAKRPLWPIFQPGYVPPAPSPKRPRPTPHLLIASKSGQRLFRAPPRASTTTTRRGASNSNSTWSGGSAGGRAFHRSCHRVPGTGFVVDSFRVSKDRDDATIHFLTHMHSDHYGGLTKTSLKRGAQIYCSETTGQLAKHILKLPDQLVRCLPIGTPVEIPCTSGNSRGATVWLYDANHCPGAVLLLFRVWSTRQWVLHCGDCRFQRSTFAAHTQLQRVVAAQSLHALYLDTTYASESRAFPAQPSVLDAVAVAARAEDTRTSGRCVFFVGSYTIGKERVAAAIAQAIGARIFADARKRAILRHCALGHDFDSRITTCAADARVHIVAMGALKADGIRRHVKQQKMDQHCIGRALAVIVKPTGWSFRASDNAPIRRSCRSTDQAVVLDVAYSEHSSVEELREFVAWSKPKIIVPTVGFHGREKELELMQLLGHMPTKRSIPHS